jgi:sugar phosphate isomerase/epimerase
MAKKLKIGIQLYTVREALKEDFEGVIERLAEIGYDGVEFAWNYGGKTPKQLAAFLKKTGIACCGLHGPLDEVVDPESKAYAYANAVGCKYVTTSCAGMVQKDWDGAIRQIRKAGTAARKAGVQFTYHNHAQEFARVNRKTALDLLYESTGKKAVQAELDTYWIKKGGADPVKYIRKYKGRVPQVHLKDMDKKTGDFAVVGTGLMDLPKIFKAAEYVGAEWVIYEQDKTQGPALEAAEKTYRNLAKAGLA